MKKIDLHIHTVRTVSDKNFTFSMDVLKAYVKDQELDAIAITNHNMFDKDQYDEIQSALDIPVFPGIEIDVEGGHLLLITEVNDLDDFIPKCKKVSEKNQKQTDSMTEKDLFEIFDDFSKYLLIPHYDKKPQLEFEKIPNLVPEIFCGEAGSEKKFLKLKKNSSEIVPVVFSDFRSYNNYNPKNFTNCQTCVDVDEISLTSLKISLTDRAKVSLTKDEGKVLFYFDDEKKDLKISSGLTVVLGERSSGKTYTLDRIDRCYENKTYIKQFELVSNNQCSDKEFEKKLRNRNENISQEFLFEFKNVVDDVMKVDLISDNKDLDNYIQALKKASQETARQDAYAKCKMFKEDLFDINSLDSLVELIETVNKLIENKEYADIISKHLPNKSLYSLYIDLAQLYIDKKVSNMKMEYANEIIENIKNDLTMLSTNTSVPDIDFYSILENEDKVKTFNSIVENLKEPKEIDKKTLNPFTNVATVRPFDNATQLKAYLSFKGSLSTSFEKYKTQTPYDYLVELIKKEDLNNSEIFKCFVRIDFEVRNSFGTKASGGEQSEYNLLQKLRDSTKNDILILDEPESSFDNLFLKSGVNKLLKELSNSIPIVISTHNNTIGLSVQPDFIIYSKKESLPNGEPEYHLYCGKPSDKYLIDYKDENNIIPTQEILLDCLEAGYDAYNDRRKKYEMYDNR